MLYAAAVRRVARNRAQQCTLSTRGGVRFVFTTRTSNSESFAPQKLADESILEHLVCPISKYPLRYDAARGLLICREIRVAYPIVEGIPMLVPTEGRVLRDDEEA